MHIQRSAALKARHSFSINTVGYIKINCNYMKILRRIAFRPEYVIITRFTSMNCKQSLSENIQEGHSYSSSNCWAGSQNRVNFTTGYKIPHYVSVIYSVYDLIGQYGLSLLGTE